jgi:[ribosomal protein S5]-alanine N-acetyltransferase
VTPFDLSTFDAPLRVPELRNGPILLRPVTLSDLPLIRAAAEDAYIPSITSVPPAYSDDNGRAFIARQQKLALDGHGYPFVIADASGPHQGLGALGLWLREIENGRASIGYWIVPAARGRHAAGFALQAAVAHAFDILAIPRLQLFIEPWNAASQRTAEYGGFTQEALLHGWERIGGTQHDAYCYALLQQDWTAHRSIEHQHAPG